MKAKATAFKFAGYREAVVIGILRDEYFLPLDAPFGRRNEPPTTTIAPLSARLSRSPVIGVAPKSTSPVAIATAIGWAALKLTVSAARPC
jgi:hypothetical protein